LLARPRIPETLHMHSAGGHHEVSCQMDVL
jgi:hypothetical protein